jgi:oxalate decarboxylase/phosphoglucose isomerase-like protein (cupin superfamily)
VFSFRAFVFSRESVELPGFDQDVYINNTDFNKRTIQDLALEYKAVREATLFLYRSFTDEQMVRMGVASNHPVSVRALVYMTAGHELHHLKIVKEKYL